MSFFLNAGRWNETLLRQNVSLSLIPLKLGTRIQYQDGVRYEAIWKATEKVKFTSSSAWELIRKKGIKANLNSFIRQKHIPFKVSFLVWRALRAKLPTHDKITTFGVKPAHCSCCSTPGMNDIHHIFVLGNFSSFIWKKISSFFGIVHRHIPMKHLMLSWRILEHKNEVQKMVQHAIPLIIYWNLWKNRCSAKYRGK